MRVVTAATIALLTLLTAQVQAGPFDVFGFGARGISMGGATTACPRDHTAVFHNPAALTCTPGAQLGLDIYTAHPNLNIELARPPKEDGLNPAPVGPHTGINLGLRLPLWPRVSAGLAVGIPFDGVLDLELLDPQIPQWTRYDALPRKFQLVAGLGVNPIDGLHIGAGLQSLARIDGGARFEMDIASQVITRRDATIELIHTASPTAGIVVEPPFLPGLAVGASWRGALELSFDLPIVFDFGESLDVALAVAGVALYVPHQINIGLSQDLSDFGAPVRLNLDLQWSLWSLAPDPSFDLSIDLQGQAPDAVGLSDALDFEVQQRTQPGFRDTLTVALGLEWEFSRGLALRVGYAARPSATGPQRGATNLIDARTHTFGLGLAVARPSALSQGEKDTTVEVALQLQTLESTQTRKDDRDDEVGDHTAGGQVYLMNVTVRHDL